MALMELYRGRDTHVGLTPGPESGVAIAGEPRTVTPVGRISAGADEDSGTLLPWPCSRTSSAGRECADDCDGCMDPPERVSLPASFEEVDADVLVQLIGVSPSNGGRMSRRASDLFWLLSLLQQT
jgi:hypothetical protein